MKFGSYRAYFKIPFLRLGIKIAKPGKPRDECVVETFLAGVIMNLKERARYKYFVLRKPAWNWGTKWQCQNEEPYWLCPTYFTCGLFNVVKHTDPLVSAVDLVTLTDNEDFLLRKTGYLSNDMHPSNWGWLDKHLVLLDYGDFNLTSYNALRVGWLDYR